MRNWGGELGKKVGFKYAERFFRIMLKDPNEAVEAEIAEAAEGADE
jgi:hypothetical protein